MLNVAVYAVYDGHGNMIATLMRRIGKHVLADDLHNACRLSSVDPIAYRVSGIDLKKVG